MTEARAKYNADDRARMAKNGQAMPDGSYPIADREDLQNAIHAVGRGGGSHNAIRQHIMRRAKALGLSSLIPDNWMADGSMGGTNAARAQLLRGAPERRQVVPFEMRENSSGMLEFRGYAALFDHPYSVTDKYGTFTETVARGAFTRTLSRQPDVVLNVDHGGLPLARTGSGTLHLSADDRGLVVSADLEPRDPDVQRIRHKLERGDLSEMSFAFRAEDDIWNDGETERTLRAVSIEGGDVSIVTRGANRDTTASIRSALSSLADFDRMLVEARADNTFDLTELREAHETLGRLIREMTPPARKTMSLKAAELALML